MKLKILFLWMAAVALSLSTGCDADDPASSYVAIDDLPKTAQEFLTDNFNSYSVTRIVENKKENERGSIFECTLQKTAKSTIASHIKVEFDRSGEWTEIESLTEGHSLPPENIDLLPAAVGQYLDAHYPGIGVEEIEREAYGYKLELLNDRELRFDKNGEFLSDDESGQGSSDGSTAYIEDFVKTHFPDYTIAYIKDDWDDGRLYKNVYLKNGYTKSYKIVFNEAGDWVEVEGDDDIYLPVPESVMQLLPATVSEYIQSHYPAAYVVEVKKEHWGYEIELSNDLDLIFDLDGNFLRVDD